MEFPTPKTALTPIRDVTRTGSETGDTNIKEHTVSPDVIAYRRYRLRPVGGANIRVTTSVTFPPLSGFSVSWTVPNVEIAPCRIPSFTCVPYTRKMAGKLTFTDDIRMGQTPPTRTILSFHMAWPLKVTAKRILKLNPTRTKIMTTAFGGRSITPT